MWSTEPNGAKHEAVSELPDDFFDAAPLNNQIVAEAQVGKLILAKPMQGLTRCGDVLFCSAGTA